MITLGEIMGSRARGPGCGSKCALYSKRRFHSPLVHSEEAYKHPWKDSYSGNTENTHAQQAVIDSLAPSVEICTKTASTV